LALPDFLKKTPGLFRMGLILVVGIGLLVFASGQKGSEGLPSDTQSALSDYGAALEKRLESMCEQAVGVGEASVMITFESGTRTEYGTGDLTATPKVQGVTVLCTGGADASVRASLSGMLSALLGIGASRICILPLAP
jgi:hypothetical protein